MPDLDIKSIKNFKSLVKYLRTKLDWPIDEDDADDLTFDYSPDELGLTDEVAVKIREIKQVRPLVEGQPWGIFWIDFEPKKLPITVMRLILNQLVTKRRARVSNRATWNLDDLLFVSAVGNEKTDQREMIFSHFHQEEGDLPTLRVLGWDGADTVLKIDYVEKTLKEKLCWPSDTQDAEAWRKRWAEAFRLKPGHVIKTADALAARLAELAIGIRATAENLMAHESERGRLRKLHKAFQTALIHDLSEKDFADTYAQTITYGLLTAAISRTDMAGGAGGTALVAGNITEMVPVTNPFLREMLDTFIHAGGRGKGAIDFDELGIQDVVELLRSEATDLPAILRDFNNRGEGEDPVIRFYEDFLEAYDKKLKVQRGVFYTPKPVVAYIVRGVHELLQTEFGLADGLADTATWGEMVKRNSQVAIPHGVAPSAFFVMVLDPATGTATFLVEVIDVIERTMKTKWARELRLSKPEARETWKHAEILRRWNEYVPNCLLPRLYGYELMMAPYAIAHMKIGLKLFETGYRFASDQRANIYLTNALEEPSQLAEGTAANLFEALGHEAQAVNKVKRTVHFTVVLGNPPYSGHSANASYDEQGEYTFIGGLLRAYYQVDGKPLGERQPKWLQDDYVKFIRFGQWCINETGAGILAMITNHGYLNNTTFRGVRQQLIKTFSTIRVLDLHGNTKKKEVAPDGGKDENVFDIQQGVAICLLVRKENESQLPKIYQADLFGTRATKYETLSQGDVADVEWERIAPQSPFYLFASEDVDLRAEYEKGLKVTDLFPANNVGFVSARDSFVLDIDEQELVARIDEFRAGEKSIPSAELESKYGIKDTKQWNMKEARNQIRADVNWKRDFSDCLYRPFDVRRVYYSDALFDRPVRQIQRNMVAGKNLALVVPRRVELVGAWQHVLVSKHIIDHVTVSLKNIDSLYPLYLFPAENHKQKNMFADEAVNQRVANLAREFIADLSSRLNLKFIPDSTGDLKKTFGPEDVFNYIYAIFHSPTYRERYAEFLKIDFPRVPLTRNVELFRQLSALGAELVALHLLESPALKKTITEFVGKGDSVVATGYPKYEKKTVWVNDEQGFEGVPQNVWDFQIGGYQVCHKWLKDRRGRKLSAEDKTHYAKIVVALKETIRLMKEIDAAIPGWPME